MGGTDAGSHPGGAKKLLTGVDGGGGESLDRYLARSALGAAPFRHLYLGAMATQNNASGDKFISYPSAGTTAAPEDDPMTAFGRLFGSRRRRAERRYGDEDRRPRRGEHHRRRAGRHERSPRAPR